MGTRCKLFGDRGYISQSLFESLYEKGIQLITKLKKNMKNKLIPFVDKILLRKRAIIESVMINLKISVRFNILYIEVFSIGPLIY
ncbi:transposase, IS4-like family protein [Leptospira kirschneri str. 200803703]|nr:transposase, IS4-like family protein [Leptospira kirschneri str. 2008720114]EMO66571.1 transposase, IS4-like family protein [Leptospira kirschneri str. 200803703]